MRNVRNFPNLSCSPIIFSKWRHGQASRRLQPARKTSVRLCFAHHSFSSSSNHFCFSISPHPNNVCYITLICEVLFSTPNLPPPINLTRRVARRQVALSVKWRQLSSPHKINTICLKGAILFIFSRMKSDGYVSFSFLLEWLVKNVKIDIRVNQ